MPKPEAPESPASPSPADIFNQSDVFYWGDGSAVSDVIVTVCALFF